MVFAVAGSLLFASHLVSVQRDLITTMFGDGAASAAEHGRYNVLLIGGDAGDGRWGLRTDSMTVASIDEETGSTILFGLPRNMTNFPFPEGSALAEEFPTATTARPARSTASPPGPRTTATCSRAPRPRASTPPSRASRASRG